MTEEKTANHLTLAMIKPHAIRARNAGEIISRIEKAGYAVLYIKSAQFLKEGAEQFYAEHKDKDFFDNLCNVMSSGPVWAMVLMKHDAANEFRKFIGTTNSADAEPGTLRHDFGDHENITNNAVHGSADDAAAVDEILFFFEKDLNLARKVDALSNQPRVE
jgi:nucleoside-diphosphate kinase